ncbi:MAG: hypothetical protein GY743_04150 [Planctomycetaceae bacterium]|nr:hypothetical protein [Planctomycetaceae bacterium]
MGVNQKCYLPRSGEMEAVIYSTVSQIRTHLSTGFDFCGKIVGKKILVKGANLHVDESVSLGDLRGVNSAGGATGLFLVQ